MARLKNNVLVRFLDKLIDVEEAKNDTVMVGRLFSIREQYVTNRLSAEAVAEMVSDAYEKQEVRIGRRIRGSGSQNVDQNGQDGQN